MRDQSAQIRALPRPVLPADLSDSCSFVLIRGFLCSFLIVRGSHSITLAPSVAVVAKISGRLANFAEYVAVK